MLATRGTGLPWGIRDPGAIANVILSTTRIGPRSSKHPVRFARCDRLLCAARVACGLPALDDTFDHWTDVFGFEINGPAAHRAELTDDGMIQIFPFEGKSFTVDDVLEFDRGDAIDFLRVEEDWRTGAFLNMPIVDVALIGLKGAVVLPTVGTMQLVNTLGRVQPIPLPGSLALPLGGVGVVGVMGSAAGRPEAGPACAGLRRRRRRPGRGGPGRSRRGPRWHRGHG